MTRITWFQRPLLLRTIHKLLILNEMLNHSKFLIFHTPREKGIESIFQSTKWNLRLFTVPPQRNGKIHFLILFKMYFGIFSRENQYTDIPYKKHLNKTSLPPNDKNSWVQWLILFSNFFIIHLQSLNPYPKGLRLKPKYLNIYLIGSILYGRITLMLLLTSSIKLLLRKEDLSKLMIILDFEQKRSNT